VVTEVVDLELGRLFFRHELKGQGVDAVAQVSLGRAVIEKMTEVTTAAGAADFDSSHAERQVQVLLDRSVPQGAIEAWPAGAGVELVLSREELGAAAGTVEDPFGVHVQKLARPGGLGRTLAQDRESIRAQPFLPLLVCQFDLTSHRTPSFILWICWSRWDWLCGGRYRSCGSGVPGRSFTPVTRFVVALASVVGMRGVILAGGSGTRLLPLTRITNKHLLPIYDRPMIQWAIEAVVKAGITEVMVVTGGAHAGEFLRLLGNGRDVGLDLLTYGYQEREAGVADALSLAEPFANGEPVLVMLADNIIERSIGPTVRAFAADPVGARILLSRVEELDHLRNLGVAELNEHKQVVRVVEKPDDPPSRYAVTGVYCYDASVFSVIQTLSPSARGELEIADVNNHYARLGQLRYDILEGFWGDAGESIDVYYAVNDFVRAHGANKG